MCSGGVLFGEGGGWGGLYMGGYIWWCDAVLISFSLT